VTTADVVIVGGGIVGVSTAYFLAASGVRNVLVLEQATVGAGASGRAAGVMLLQGESEQHLRWQLEGIEVHRRLQAEVGTDLTEHGSLLVWCAPEAAARARASVPLHANLGIALEILAPEEVRHRFPYLATDDVVLATYSARDPWAPPLPTVQRIAAAARERGAVIREHCEVTGVEIDPEGRVERVVTPDDSVSTRAVVNAAGAWARGVGETVGVRLPISPRKRQVFVVDPQGVVPPGGPFIMEEEKDFYCTTRPEGLIMVQGQSEGETLETAVEWGYLDAPLGSLLHRIPALREAPLTGAWAGIRPMPRDGHPLLGQAPGIGGYYVAGGFGGQGFTRGPLAGRLMAELITTGQASRDLSPYRVDRVPQTRGHVG
jgi:sarcosine oxidase, subunit beta